MLSNSACTAANCCVVGMSGGKLLWFEVVGMSGGSWLARVLGTGELVNFGDTKADS